MKNSLLYARIITVGMVLATGLLTTHTYTSSNFVAVQENPHVTELLAAARNGNIDGIKIALTFVDIDSQNSAGITALMRAAQNNNVDTIKFLLSKKANPNMVDELGMTALEWALYANPVTSKSIQRNVKKILELLINAGAKKTEQARKTAVKFGYPEDIVALLKP